MGTKKEVVRSEEGERGVIRRKGHRSSVGVGAVCHLLQTASSLSLSLPMAQCRQAAVLCCCVWFVSDTKTPSTFHTFLFLLHATTISDTVEPL